MESPFLQFPVVYRTVLEVMIVLAIIVYIALQYFKAGYGYLRTSNWGPSISNKVAWVLMETPVFVGMTVLFFVYGLKSNISVIVMTVLFLTHYLQRSLIFPFLLKGKSKMPIAIMLMGATFNLVNAYMIGCWLYIYSLPPYTAEPYYTTAWLYSPQFIVGTVLFIAGMVINLHSDYIIRHLRKPGDNKHYIPKGGMFTYVSSANYFGEILEWFGFAILTWSIPGAIFCIWTFANLAPRANSLYEKYAQEFGEEFTSLKRKKVIPFIY